MDTSESEKTVVAPRKTWPYLLIMSSAVTLPMVWFFVHQFNLDRKDYPLSYLHKFGKSVADVVAIIVVPVAVIYISDYVAKKTKSGILTFLANFLSLPILYLICLYSLGSMGFGVEGIFPALIALPQLITTSIFTIIITALNAPLKIR